MKHQSVLGMRRRYWSVLAVVSPDDWWNYTALSLLRMCARHCWFPAWLGERYWVDGWVAIDLSSSPENLFPASLVLRVVQWFSRRGVSCRASHRHTLRTANYTLVTYLLTLYGSLTSHRILPDHSSFLKPWLGSWMISVLDLGAEGPGFKSQLRRCRVTVFGKLFTPMVGASVHQAAKLVAALLRVARVTAILAESNGSLPPGLWFTSQLQADCQEPGSAPEPYAR